MEPSTNLFELHVDHNGTSLLRETAKWSKFLSIVGFVTIGLFLLVMIFAGSSVASKLSASYGEAGNLIGTIYIGVVCAIMIICFFPYLYLYRFATKMQVALRNNDQDTLNASFENLKSCFKFVGIFTIICLALYGLIFVFAFLAALSAGAS